MNRPDFDLPCQAFSFELYFERPGKAPQAIVLGQNLDTQQDAFIHQSNLNCHVYCLGKTGAGKTYWLFLHITNLLAMGYRVIFFDPLGSLFDLVERWVAARTRDYYLLGEKRFAWFQENFLDRTLFMDLSHEDHPYRSNMMQRFSDESPSQHINRLVMFFDSMFSSMDVELQRRQGLVTMAAIFCATQTPFNRARDFIYDENDFQSTLIQQVEQVSSLGAVHRAVKHWRWVRKTYKGSSYGDKIFSLLTALNPLEEDISVANFILDQESNVDWPDIFTNKSLFIKGPSRSKSAEIVMKYFYNGVSYPLISRRAVTENTDTMFIGSDESAVVFDEEYSRNITQSRNKRVFMISAHQARQQLLTDELIRVAATIEDQSDICVYFRVGYQDAKKIVEEKLSPDELRVRYTEEIPTIGKSISGSHSSGFSKALSIAKSWLYSQSTQRSHSNTVTSSSSVSETKSIAESVNEQYSLAKTKSRTVIRNAGKTFNLTWSKGENVGRTKTDGFSLTYTEGEATAHVRTKNGTVTISEGSTKGTTNSDGRSRSFSQSRNSSANSSFLISHDDGNGISRPVPNALNSQVADAFQKTKSLSRSISEGTSRAEGQGESFQQSSSKNQALGLSKQLGESVATIRNFAEGVAQSVTEGESYGDTSGETSAIGSSLSLTSGLSIIHGKSIAEAVSVSHGESSSEGANRGETFTENESITKTIGESISISVRKVYYTVQEVFDLLVRKIRDLPPRQFLLCVRNNVRIFVKTAEYYEMNYKYGKWNFLTILRRYQKSLFTGESIDEFADIPKESKSEEIEIYPALDDFDHFIPGDE